MRVPEDTQKTFVDADLASLGFQAHFGRDYPPARTKILNVAAASAKNVGNFKDDGLDDNLRHELGDFEVRVARALIGARDTETALGVENRLAGEDISMTYLDVEQRGTKKVS